MSYIGSKINVTTVSGNQYDGVLASVNAREKTIELRMAKQVGPVRDGPSYEFIVFKSDDIQDLQVYDEPQPGKEQYSDPAILSAKPQGQQRQDQSKKPTAFGSFEPEEAKVQLAQKQENPQSIQQQQPKNFVVNSATIPTTFAAAAAAGQAAPTFSPRRPGREQVETQKVRSYSTITKQTTQVDIPVNNSDGDRHQRQYARGPQIPKSEFDFQRANQMFDKDQVAAEVAPVLSGDAPYYSKNSSFFDNISTELSSGPEGGKTRTERSWNIDTFGRPYVKGNLGRGGGGGNRGRGVIHRNATGSFQ